VRHGEAAACRRTQAQHGGMHAANMRELTQVHRCVQAVVQCMRSGTWQCGGPRQVCAGRCACSAVQRAVRRRGSGAVALCAQAQCSAAWLRWRRGGVAVCGGGGRWW